MQHDEFIGQVQARARLESRGAAERACRATLETLGERLPQELAENLAAQLPQDVMEHLQRYEHGTGEPLGQQEFLRRVADRAGVDEAKAEQMVSAVMGVVAEATVGGLMERVGAALPRDLRALVTAGSHSTAG